VDVTQNKISQRNSITKFVASVNCLLFVTTGTYLLRMFLFL